MLWAILVLMLGNALLSWRVLRAVVAMRADAGEMGAALKRARGTAFATRECAVKAHAVVEQLVELAKAERETAELELRAERKQRARAEGRPLRAALDRRLSDDEPDEEPTEVVPFQRLRLLRGPRETVVAGADEGSESCRTEDERAVLAALVELEGRLGLAELATVALAQRVCRLAHARGATLRQVSAAIAEIEAAPGAQLTPRFVVKRVLLASMGEASIRDGLPPAELPADGDRVEQLPAPPSVLATSAAPAPRGAA
jgi:hypothetical protein